MEITDVEMGHDRREDGPLSTSDMIKSWQLLEEINEDGPPSTSDMIKRRQLLRENEDGFSLTYRIERVLDNLRQPPRMSECCIYRVRGSLRKLNEAAYTPRVVSIGPFHHGKKELQTMEKYKERYLYDFLQRSHKISLENMVTSIKEMEERVRRCYAEIIELSSDELVKMILFDGVFIIEYFLRWCDKGSDDRNDGALYKPYFIEDITIDLILLENQLPFFVLEELYNLVFLPKVGVDDSFLTIAQNLFSCFNKQRISMKGQEVLHFTDLVRSFHLPSSLPPRVNEEYRYSFSATELHKAGVKFKVNASSLPPRLHESQCLFDIQFTNNGVLQIPRFVIEDRTESLFRNLMAFEQCYYPYQSYICEYINLMDTLIDTAKDVELLVQIGIIDHFLGGNDAVAILFNNLCLRIMVDAPRGYFSEIKNDLTKYYKDPWHNWKATLKRDYFSTPWRIASTIAAVLLLIFTGTQTVKAFF